MTTDGCEDLEFNTFYSTLQTQYRQKFEEAQRKCYTICVPQSSSVHLKDIDKRLIDLHILIPSPFFKDQYVTADKEHSVRLDGNTFTTLQGFDDQVTAHILAEEVGYNNNYEAYRVLLIDQPFVNTSHKKHEPSSSTSATVDLYNLEPTYTKCLSYLQHFPECSKDFKEIEHTMKHLQENYMIIKGFLEETSAKLKKIWKDLNKHFLIHMKPAHLADSRIKNNVEMSIESCIVGSVHSKLFCLIREELVERDRTLTEKIHILQPLPPAELGVPEQFSCSMSSAVAEIRNLLQAQTVLEILLCIKNTLNLITESVNTHLRQTQNDNEDARCLTSDDYIPLFLYVLCQADVRHLSSVVYYIDNFHWASCQTGQLGYSLVTFKAVMSYLSTMDANNLAKNYRTKLRSVKTCHKPPSVKPDNSTTSRSTDSHGGSSMNSVDLQLARITRKLESSTKEFVTANKRSEPHTRVVKPTRGAIPKSEGKSSAPLGDFLSTLQEDSYQCHGKQS